jgi:hypothetical protein
MYQGVQAEFCDRAGLTASKANDGGGTVQTGLLFQKAHWFLSSLTVSNEHNELLGKYDC